MRHIQPQRRGLEAGGRDGAWRAGPANTGQDYRIYSRSSSGLCRVCVSFTPESFHGQGDQGAAGMSFRSDGKATEGGLADAIGRPGLLISEGDSRRLD